MKKGVSAIIAVILLLMITVALMSMFWAFSSGMFGSVTAGAGKQADAAIRKAGTELTIINAKAASQSLVGYWKFDENSGATAADSSGNGNDGTLINNPVWVAGKIGSALSLTGASNQYVRRASFNNLPTGSSARTMAAWINPASYPDGTYNGIVAYGAMACTGQGSLLSIKNDGRLSMAFWCDDAYQTIGPTIPFNQWTHVALTYSGGTTVRFYINGQFVQESSLTAASAPANTQSGPIRIGCTDDPGRCFNGIIDEVRIYSRALNETEISDLYNNKKSIDVTIRNSGTQNIDLDTLVTFVDDNKATNTASGTLTPGSVSTFTVLPSAVKCDSVLKISVYASDTYYTIKC